MSLLINTEIINITSALKHIHCPKCFTILSYSLHFSNLSDDNSDIVQIAFICKSMDKKCDYEKHFIIPNEKINNITIEYLKDIIQKYITNVDTNKIR